MAATTDDFEQLVALIDGLTDAVGRLLRESFGGTPQVIGKTVRIERSNGHEFIPQLVRSYPGRIDAVTYSKPTLEDVFIHETGHRFWEDNGEIK